MELSEKQRRLAERVLSRWGIRDFMIAEDLIKGIIAEQPDIQEEKLQSEVKSRVKRVNETNALFWESLHNAQTDYPQAFSKLYLTTANSTSQYFSLLRRSGFNFEDSLKSFKLFARIAPAWAKAKPQQIGNFVVLHGFWEHDESPLCIRIQNSNGQTIATIGGYPSLEGKRIGVRISNIQGSALKITPSKSIFKAKEQMKEYQKQFPELSKAVGESWRVFFIKQVLNTAKARGFPVAGELPKRYYIDLSAEIPATSDKEYKRQVRQYRQTYKKAGMIEQPDKTWRAEFPKARKPRIR